MIQVEQRITDWSIAGSETTPTAPAPLMPRPEKLSGATYKISPPVSEQSYYITINNALFDGDRLAPFEIFINSKNMEHYQWTVALTRVLSAVLRRGDGCAFLVDELLSVFDPHGGYFKKGGRYVPSIVAEIGGVLKVHMQELGLYPNDRSVLREQPQGNNVDNEQPVVNDAIGVVDPLHSATFCPKCNQRSLVNMDNCLTCLQCGYSKCS